MQPVLPPACDNLEHEFALWLEDHFPDRKSLAVSLAWGGVKIWTSPLLH